MPSYPRYLAVAACSVLSLGLSSSVGAQPENSFLNTSPPVAPTPRLSPQEEYAQAVHDLEAPMKDKKVSPYPYPLWDDLDEAKLLVYTSEIAEPRDPNVRTPITSLQRVVYNTGEVKWSYYDSLSRGRGVLPSLSRSEMRRLDALLAQLPPDAGVLPPDDRRIFVRVRQNGHPWVRVYDRAQIPAVLRSVVKLIGESGAVLAPLSSRVPVYQPTSTWPIGMSDMLPSIRLYDAESVRSAPNGQFWISSLFPNVMDVRKSGDNRFLAQFEAPQSVVSDVRLSPNSSLVAVAGDNEVAVFETQNWKEVQHFSGKAATSPKLAYSTPRFTSNGRTLLVQTRPLSRFPGMEFSSLRHPASLVGYDTRTWKRLDKIAGVPPRAQFYVDTPNSTRALYLSQQGFLALWDKKHERNVAVLDQRVRVVNAAFSPDGSLVAVTTIGEAMSSEVHRLRLWNTSNGQFLHELTPFDTPTWMTTAGLFWSPDGRYVGTVTHPVEWDMSLAAVGRPHPLPRPTDTDRYWTTMTDTDRYWTTTPKPLEGPWDVQLWNASSGRHRAVLPIEGRRWGILGVDWLSDQELVVDGSDGAMRSWDMKQILPQVEAFEKALKKAE